MQGFDLSIYKVVQTVIHTSCPDIEITASSDTLSNEGGEEIEGEEESANEEITAEEEEHEFLEDVEEETEEQVS